MTVVFQKNIVLHIKDRINQRIYYDLRLTDIFILFFWLISRHIFCCMVGIMDLRKMTVLPWSSGNDRFLGLKSRELYQVYIPKGKFNSYCLINL